MRGSSFEDSKHRINEFAKTNPSNADFAAFLSKEYGTGGRSGYGDIVTSQNHNGKGISLDIRDENAPNGKRKILIKYTQAAERISELVAKDEYFTESDKQKRIKHAKYVWNQERGQIPIRKTQQRHKLYNFHHGDYSVGTDYGYDRSTGNRKGNDSVA